MNSPSRRSSLIRRRLAQLRSKVVFTVSGYDDDHGPLCTVPSVRKFFSLCHSRWPCWAFYADLQGDCLAMIAASVVANLSSIQRTRRKVEVIMQHSELVNAAISQTTPRSAHERRSWAILPHRTIPVSPAFPALPLSRAALLNRKI